MLWPRWYPGLELSADHLIALEDYLLERSRFVDSAFGVADFQYRHLCIEEGEAGALLKLFSVKGLTPGGQPVKVDPTAPLIHPLPAQGGEFDIWVVVNPDSQLSNANDDPRKIVLLLDDSSAATNRIEPAAFRDRLYLGRYSLNDQSVAIVHRPIPLYLAGLAPHDSDWEDWTNVLPQTIQAAAAAVREFDEKHPDARLTTSVVLGELLKLAIDWPVEPFTRLARRLFRARLLTTTLFKGEDFAGQAMLQPTDAPRKGATGDNLPEQLAAVLEPVFSCLPASAPRPSPEVGMKVLLERSKRYCLLYESLEDEGEHKFRGRVESEQLFLRWYNLDSSMEEKRQALEALIDRGPPSECYIWPRELARSEQADGFGWVRGFAEETSHELKAVGSRALTAASITAGINLIQRFRELHDAELCLIGLALSDVLVDKASQVLILFNDNISVKDEITRIEPKSRDLLAPELTSGLVAADYSTDRWTLGVLLFWVFFGTHPLHMHTEGSDDFDPFSKEPNRKNEPIFLFGSDSDPSKLDQSVLKRWKVFPGFFQDAFHQVLVAGVDNPKARLQESQWIEHLLRLRDCLYVCENAACRHLAFYDRAALAAGDQASACDMCGSALIVPPRLKLGPDTLVMLCPNAKVYARHVDDGEGRDFDVVVATVEEDLRSGVWGLVNRSQSDWYVRYKNREPHKLQPGHAWPLDSEHLEASVDFGTIKGTIRARQPLSEIASTKKKHAQDR